MTSIGKLYAQALYSLAKEENLSGEILSELNALNEAFLKDGVFLKLLSSPNLSKEERLKIVDDSFEGKVQPYVLCFIKLLTEKGYARHFSDCVTAYKELYNEDHGILPVKAVTAVALTDQQREKLCDKLAKLTGKTIELDNVIDPECLGGVRLDYDGKRVDDTVQNRLDSIRSLLKNTVL